ncbi:MAG: PIN domain-containing protein, partial [Burkholderiales bacterium]|nr:PIN domain-containing protein [Burkholderiales bacterium]
MELPDPALAPAIVVLDTNVVLDWLVFHNPECGPLHASITAGRVRWVATAAMRDELAHVLGRRMEAWRPDLAVLWARWSRHCIEAPTPAVNFAPSAL